MPVHQFLPHLADGDAIGFHVLRMQRALEELGPSKIYVQSVDAPLRSRIDPYQWFRPAKDDVVIYHSSIGNPMARALLSTDVAVIVDYHNVTPMHFYAGYEPRVAALLYAGRVECRLFSKRSPLGLADSGYSAMELDTMGFPKTATVPILIDFPHYEQEPSRKLLRKLQASKRGSDLLFVGRISPNKRQEDVIKAFAAYQRTFEADARLFLVGKSSSRKYLETLEAFVERLELKNVVITGGVSFDELLAYYSHCDLFLSMSEHEGFGVPLVEAMLFDLPVVAYSAAAIPETLGGAGILTAEKDYDEIAGLVHLALTDEALRQRLAQARRERLEHFRPGPHQSRFLELVRSVA